MKKTISLDSPAFELGDVNIFEATVINWILRNFISELRGLLERHGDQGCGSCAFNPLTDNWTGFEHTAYAVAWTLCHHRRFLCHRNQPQWRANVWRPQGALLCRNYLTLLDSAPQEARELARITMMAIHEFRPTIETTFRAEQGRPFEDNSLELAFVEAERNWRP